MPDFAARRTIMVDTQVRPSDVTKFPVIDAMLRIPREEFVPDHLVEAAYMGENLTLADGRVLLDPRSLSKMVDALDVGESDLVLDIGCGTGYSAAVLSELAQAVVAVEEDASLADDAERALARAGVDTVVLHRGALAEGAPEHAPYDVIMLQGAVEVFPAELVAQLRDGGRVAALFMEGALGVARLGVKQGSHIAWRDSFNAAAPVLPGFARRTVFTL